MFTTVYCLGLLFLFKAMTSDSFSTDCGEPGLCHDMLIDQQACASLDNCILQGDSKYVINYLVFTALKVILTKMFFLVYQNCYKVSHCIFDWFSTFSGRSVANATWVSFNSDIQGCTAFNDCGNLDSTANDTVSSPVNCTICYATGICQGELLRFVKSESIDDCIDECRMKTNGCKWSSYNFKTGFCDLFEACSQLIADETWVSSEVNCLTAPPSTSTSTIVSTQTITTSTSFPTSLPAPMNEKELVWIDGLTRVTRLGNLNYLYKYK